MKRPEILSPAGNFEKMRTAILYGADAVYLSGQIFGMRAAADNFSLAELAEAVEYAHKRGVKVYLTVNITPHVYEYDELEQYLTEIKDFGIDALIRYFMVSKRSSVAFRLSEIEKRNLNFIEKPRFALRYFVYYAILPQKKSPYLCKVFAA